jgi:hypothetical protein
MDSDIRFTQSAVVIISMMLTALVGTITVLFRVLMQAKDAQTELLLKNNEALNAELKKQNDMFKSMAVVAIANLEAAANIARQKAGQPPIERIAAVIPESNSPPSQEQIDEAERVTLRARLTAATMALNLPARAAGDPVGPVEVATYLAEHELGGKYPVMLVTPRVSDAPVTIHLDDPSQKDEPIKDGDLVRFDPKVKEGETPT